jgi:hypothetical protein
VFSRNLHFAGNPQLATANWQLATCNDQTASIPVNYRNKAMPVKLKHLL